MSWVLRIFGFPVATVDYEGDWVEEPEGISGGATHDYERGDNDQTAEIEGEDWDYYEESDFGFRRP
ncbi:hypothetical protein PBI_ARISSANAE_27 [Mycobacterium phage Arissanae]|nr:hypothetical protein PBI_ARISSANAE_27 [Mycobacterium phage Arissanae]